MRKIDKIILGLIILGIFHMPLLLIKSIQHNKYQQLSEQYELLKKQFNSKSNSINVIEKNRIKEKDSLKNLINLKEIENRQLLSENSALENKIVNLENKKIVVPKDITGLVDYFNTRYKTKENKIVEDRVGLTTTTAYNTSYELEEKDNYFKMILLKDEQLNNTNKIVQNLESNIKESSIILNSAEKELQQRKELQKIAENNINNLENQNKKLFNKNKLNKILIPASIIIGGFTGYQFAK